MRRRASLFPYILGFKRSRKFPIQRDEFGKSLRQRAFEAFDEEKRPMKVSRELHANPKTVLRYFEAWKKRKQRLSYSTLRRHMRKNPKFSEKWIEMLADYFEVPREKIIRRMQQPWGLMDLSKGELPDKRLERTRSEIEARLEGALRLISLREHLYRNSPKEIKELLKRIVSLKDKTDLIVSHVNGKIIIKERKSVITVESPYFYQSGGC